MDPPTAHSGSRMHIYLFIINTQTIWRAAAEKSTIWRLFIVGLQLGNVSRLLVGHVLLALLQRQLGRVPPLLRHLLGV